jgi:hypothetical protein
VRRLVQGTIIRSHAIGLFLKDLIVFLEIRSSGEGFVTSPGDDGYPDRRLVTNFHERIDEPLAHILIQRVHTLRTVDSDVGDVLFLFE